MPPRKRLRAVTEADAAPEPPKTPWGMLGFDTERDMLLDDLRVLAERIKSPTTTATAVAALSKRKQEVFEQIKQLDAGDDESDVLDDSEDEAWDVGG